jgi:hypothetical protein
MSEPKVLLKSAHMKSTPAFRSYRHKIRFVQLLSVMKKRLFLFVFSILLPASVIAQEYKSSMGLRAGLPVGLSAKHFLNTTYAVEGILATRWGGFVLAGFFEKEYRIVDYPGFYWFWGGGAHFGKWDEGYNPRIKNTYSGPVLGIDGIIGVEYSFEELPLNLSLDLFPSFNLVGYTGWGGINGAFSVRYVF